MTLIAGIGFLDEAYLLSDSRISYKGYKPSEDKLMKVYQIAPTLAVGLTSEHVAFSLEVLRRVTEFSFTNTNSKLKRFILPYLIRRARFEYNELSKSLDNIRPKMDFIYAGVVNKPQMFSSYLMYKLMKDKNGPFRIPEKIGKAMKDKTEGIWSLDPPSPILYKQSFPDNSDHSYINLGYVTAGSGQEFFYELEKEYAKLFDFGFGIEKGILIEHLATSYITNAKIDTVGGIVQVWRINSAGMRPITYAMRKNDKNGKETTLKELQFTGQEWVLIDHKSNTKSKATFAELPYLNIKQRIRVEKQSWSNY